LADHHPDAFAFGFENREVRFLVMGKGGISLFVDRRQRYPGLQSEQSGAASLQLRASPLRMRDATSGCHPVHRAWADRHHCAKAVTVDYFPVKQIRDRGEVDVRMWADIDTLADAELGRPHLVQENKRADQLAHPGGQCTANLEAAKIAGAGHNHCFD
jgi:hypothetical protein